MLQPVSEKETMSVIGNISSRKAVDQNLISKEFKDKNPFNHNHKHFFEQINSQNNVKLQTLHLFLKREIN